MAPEGRVLAYGRAGGGLVSEGMWNVLTSLVLVLWRVENTFKILEHRGSISRLLSLEAALSFMKRTKKKLKVDNMGKITGKGTKYLNLDAMCIIWNM